MAKSSYQNLDKVTAEDDSIFQSAQNDLEAINKIRENNEKKIQEQLKKIQRENAKQVALEIAKIKEQSLIKDSKLEAKLQQNLLTQYKLQSIKTHKEILAEQDKLSKENYQRYLSATKKEREEMLKQISAATGQSTQDVKNQLRANAMEAAKRDAHQKNIEALVGSVGKVINKIGNQLDNYITKSLSYQQQVNTRLQGTGKNWQGGALGLGGIHGTISGVVGLSPFVSSQAVYDNIVKLTSSGIAYNLEQRAFLETISENIATTFSTFDGSLNRLIRLQQQDSSAARLGMEASLTTFLNSMYQNTEYLNSTYDTVSTNLLETVSLMSGEQGVEFEYQVQKWLGSLMSLGFNESAIGNISAALGLLGSGNVSALSSNAPMMSLLAMAASRSGQSIGGLFGNLNASSVNTLLGGLVSYLQEVASSGNRVTQAELASIFGMSVSDLQAIRNLDASGLASKVLGSNLTYGGAINELYNQYSFGTQYSRVGMGKMMENIFNNALFGSAANIAANPLLYATWRAAGLLDEYVGGIKIPSVFAMGTGADTGLTVANLMKMGTATLGSIGLLGQIFSAMGQSGSANALDKLGIRTSGGRRISTVGRGLRNLVGGQDTSSLGVFGVGDTSAIQETAFEEGQRKASDLTEAATEGEATLTHIRAYLTGEMNNKLGYMVEMLASMSGRTYSQELSNSKDVGSEYSIARVNQTSTNESSVELQNVLYSDVSKMREILETVSDGTALRVKVQQY